MGSADPEDSILSNPGVTVAIRRRPCRARRRTCAAAGRPAAERQRRSMVAAGAGPLDARIGGSLPSRGLPLFSPRAYWRMFEMHNCSRLPDAGCSLQSLPRVRRTAWQGRGSRSPCVSVSPVGWSFFGTLCNHQLGWVYVAPACASSAAAPDSPAPAETIYAQSSAAGSAGWVGGSLTVFAVIGQPLLDLSSGAPGLSEIVGVDARSHGIRKRGEFC